MNGVGTRRLAGPLARLRPRAHRAQKRGAGDGAPRLRLLFLVVLVILLDLCTVVTATPWGLVWDDDEAARLGRGTASPRRPGPAVLVPFTSIVAPAPHQIVRSSPPSDRPAAVDVRPRADLSTREPTAPTEDH
jgi:hypothetical protein